MTYPLTKIWYYTLAFILFIFDEGDYTEPIFGETIK